MQPWDASGQYFLCMEMDFQDRAPTADDELTIGAVNLQTGEFEALCRTKAWNTQQGCMLHWLSGNSGSEILFNDRIDNDFRAVVLNIHTGKKRVLPKAIQAIAPDGKHGACLNFARWAYWRPGYGYQGIPDPFAIVPQPANDAVYLMNLQSGEFQELATLRDVASLTSDHDFRRNSYMWFNHLMFNTDGTRLVGLVRWWCGDLFENQAEKRRHCMWTIDTDGENFDIIASDALVSHAEWRDPDHILYFGNRRAGEPLGYLLVNVVTKETEIIGEKYLRVDGHMSYYRNKPWLLTDTYPDPESNRTLKIYDIDKDTEIILGRFYSQPHLQGELRCDLHPCWNRDYTQVAIDSSHEGSRQAYVVDVGDLENTEIAEN